ncbi:MAG: hypothetical protein WA857_15545 [Candidatus Acidiferrum sp.]
MNEPPIPSVLAMLVCDQVIVDQQTQKKSLIGIFENLNAVGFPAALNCAVYARLADAEGHYKFRLRLVSLKDERLLSEITFEGNVQRREQPAELALYLAGIPLTEPGKYEIQSYADDVFLARTTLNALQISLPGAPPWQQ